MYFIIIYLYLSELSKREVGDYVVSINSIMKTPYEINELFSEDWMNVIKQTFSCSSMLIFMTWYYYIYKNKMAIRNILLITRSHDITSSYCNLYKIHLHVYVYIHMYIYIYIYTYNLRKKSGSIISQIRNWAQSKIWRKEKI